MWKLWIIYNKTCYTPWKYQTSSKRNTIQWLSPTRFSPCMAVFWCFCVVSTAAGRTHSTWKEKLSLRRGKCSLLPLPPAYPSTRQLVPTKFLYASASYVLISILIPSMLSCLIIFSAIKSCAGRGTDIELTGNETSTQKSISREGSFCWLRSLQTLMLHFFVNERS